MSVWKTRKKYLLETLNPMLSDIGFEAVGTTKHGSRTTATHVEFERHHENSFDNLTLIFDKYWRPKFQITFQRRDINTPHKVIISGHLVRRRRQLTSWWGVWWFSLNKEKSWERSINQVVKRFGQIDIFLNTSVAGKNVTDMTKYF